MRRVLIITASVLIFLIAVVLLAYGFLFHTGTGKRIIADQIEGEIGDALDSRAEIASLSGNLPNHIVLSDVVLSGEDGPWLTVKEIDLVWRPFALIGQSIEIESLKVEGGRLLQAPPGNGEKEEREETVSLSLPDNLPKLVIGNLEINDFETELSGAMRRLDGVASLRMGGEVIDVQARLTSSDDLDSIDVILELAPEQKRLFIDSTVIAREGGAIAALTGIDGGLFLEAKSDGPIDDAAIDFNGSIAGYGDFTSNIAGSLEDMTGADISLEFTPDADLSDEPELSSPIVADLRLEEMRNGGKAIIHSSTSAIGEISGTIEWLNRNDALAVIKANLNGSISPDYRADVQEYSGSRLSVNTELTKNNQNFDVVAVIESERGILTIEDGETDLDKLLSGDVTFDSKGDPEAAFPFNRELTITGILSLDLENAVQLKALSITSPDRSTAGGEAAFSFEDESIYFNGDVTASPEFLASLSSAVGFSDFVTADIELSGPADKFTLKANIDAPSSTLEGKTVPPFSSTIALAGLPKLPTGDISARAKGNNAGRLDAQLRSSVNGKITLSQLLYTGAGFKLNGSGDYTPSEETVHIDLTYQGAYDAEPWPGLELAGELNAKGVLSRNGELNDLTVESDRVRINDILLDRLVVTAEGPPGAARVRLKGENFILGDTQILSDFNARSIVRAEGPLTVNLNAFDGVLFGTNANLTEPSKISFSDGPAIENLRLSYGRMGSIALDGSFQKNRWLVRANLEEANVPNTDGRITLALDLDTDRKRPAEGTLRLRSLLTENQSASIGAAFSWDGQTVTLTNLEDAKILDMRLVLPLRLQREPSIKLNPEGPLDGYIRYSGDVQAIAAYLPPELQTLEGALQAEFTVAGDTSSPDLSGQAQLTDGRYTELQSNLSLVGAHIRADATYAGAGSTVNFSGGARGASQTGEDTIIISGGLTLGDKSNLKLKTELKNAEFSAYPVSTVRADGEINIEGPLDEIVAKGSIKIRELDAEIITPESTGLVDIEVVTYSNESPELPELMERPAPTFAYDVDISADNRIFIRGRGLESEWAANVTIVSGRESALITGEMNLQRGWLDFSGRRFEMTRGAITFDKLSPNNPILDIRAEYETTEGITAIIAVSGRAEKPNVELLSTPSRPSEDVMALVLFGKPASELSAIESLQTAQALASLSGVGPFGGEGVTGRLRQAIGLDMLNLDIDPQTGGGSLTVGKYVSDDIFVSATQDAQGQEGSVRIEYDITNNISVETEIAQDGDQTVSANWKKDF